MQTILTALNWCFLVINLFCFALIFMQKSVGVLINYCLSIMCTLKNSISVYIADMKSYFVFVFKERSMIRLLLVDISVECCTKWSIVTKSE